MVVLELSPDQPVTMHSRTGLTIAEIQDFVGGPLEGISINSSANWVIVYVNRDRNAESLRENFRLENGVVVRGNAMVVGIGRAGQDRGLTGDEIASLDLWQYEYSHLLTLRYVPEDVG